MLYWTETAGAPVFISSRRIGHIESIMLDPEMKIIMGFLLERRNCDFRYRYFPFVQIQDLKRDGIQLKKDVELRTLSKSMRKKYILTDDLLSHPIQDEKGEWIGRLVDFGYDTEEGFVREIILSDSLVDDLWNGRKKLPVLSQVEFSKELVIIDQDSREEITGLQKGLKKWFEMDSI